MSASGLRPLVGITCCARPGTGGRTQHAVADSYVQVTDRVVRAVPVLVPANGEAADIPTLVRRLDGLILTGSHSNVQPDRYGGTPHPPGTLEDERRDAVTLPLARAAIAAGLPLLAICRGFQELNVALGGSLHQRLQDLDDRIAHFEPDDADDVRRASKVHLVTLAPGSLLGRLAGSDTTWVNSLHDQGIDRLASRLAVEARAIDGVIEAVRVAGAPGFALGLQWHPELDCDVDPISRGLFESFAAAIRRRG